MKISKIALSILCLVAMTSYGQTEKGNFLIAANSGIGYSSFSTDIGNGDSTDNSQFSVSGATGYFIIDNLSAGITVNYGRGKTENQTTTNSSFGPFVKYYFLPGNIKPFLETSYTFGELTSNILFLDPFGAPIRSQLELDQNRFQANAGVAFFINKVVAVELSLGYFDQTIDGLDDPFIIVSEQSTNGFISRVGFSIFL